MTGNPPVTLPPVVQKLMHVPDLLVGDVLYVWDFLTVFSKELNLKPMLVDEFVELLQYRGAVSPALVEIYVALVRQVYQDHTLCNTVAAGIPAHLNILSRSSEDEAKGGTEALSMLYWQNILSSTSMQHNSSYM